MKFVEITEEWYPFFKDEIKSFSFQRDIAVIEFKNGSRIDNLANAQTTKGQRRTRGGVDESARLNNAVFKDAVQPVFSLRRWTGGDVQDPYELNGQFHYFTTSGFKGTEEFIRTLSFVDDMANCKGAFVFGANWELPVHWGLLTKKFVMDIKNDETTSPIAFQQNYESIWVGAGESGLVQIDKVLALRKPILKVELKQNGNDEYIICMDVARSKSSSNNQSAYVIGKVNRLKNGSVKSVDIVNIYVPQNGLTFKDQTIILKKLQKAYNSQMVVVDSSGIGKAICDYCIEELEDSETGEVFEAWDCMNDSTFVCKEENAPKLLYSLNASGINTNIIVNFWDYVDSMKLNLLPSERNAKISNKISEMEKINTISAHMRTDILIEQLANLEVINKNGGKMEIKQVTKKIDKDIYSALVYLLYVVQYVMNDVKREPKHSHADFVFYD